MTTTTTFREDEFARNVTEEILCFDERVKLRRIAERAIRRFKNELLIEVIHIFLAATIPETLMREIVPNCS